MKSKSTLAVPGPGILAPALFLVAVLFLAACQAAPAIDAIEPPDALIEDIMLSGEDFVAQTVEGMGLTAAGLTQESTVTSGIFVSEPVEAPFPFNAVVPQWVAELPEEASLDLSLRTSQDGQSWLPWQAIEENSDWMRPEDTDRVGQMIVIDAEDETHRFVQYMVVSQATDSQMQPSLQELRLTFIDSTQGPTADQLVAQQQILDATLIQEGLLEEQDGYPKPFIVSRASWCRHADCVYSQGLNYYPVSHLLIHHTVSNNNSPDWAATVRAVWNFHTYSRGWGDIGYNYLVDPNGVIYEGHFGGDDVIGTHAAGANAGSMAVALLGTFTDPDYSLPGIKPPDAMVDSAVEILSWKADQRDIDVYDASNTLPDIDWGLPNLMGHRDVYGTTECPGSQAHRLIPEIRDRIAGNIGLVSPHIYVDELSSAFTRSNANWHVASKQCGYNNNAYYTWSVTEPAESVNWGEWQLNVPADGRYEIEAYAPYCKTGSPETAGARYSITHAGGTSEIIIDQDNNVGLWSSLGEYTLQATGNKVRLTDLTTTDNDLGVWFDALRLKPATSIPVPTVSNGAPEGDAWLNQPANLFEWQIENPASVTRTVFELSADPDFSRLITSHSWQQAVSSTSYTFSEDYPQLFWRVTLSWPGGGPIPGSTSQFRLDTTPPTSSMTVPFYSVHTNLYRLSWMGEDALSGLTAYNIDFREKDGRWLRWLTGTKSTTANFVLPNPSLAYEFRSQGIDIAGNSEIVSGNPDTGTDEAIMGDNVVLLPLAVR